MKTKQILTVLLLAMMLVPTVSACHWEPPVEEPEPVVVPMKVQLTTTIRNSHLTYVWNGKGWINNPNYTIEVVNGRTYLTYLPYPNLA